MKIKNKIQNMVKINPSNIIWEKDLLKDVIGIFKDPNIWKNDVYTEDFNKAKNLIIEFMNWNYHKRDYSKVSLLLIISSHPFWENIILNGNKYQKEYLDWFLSLAMELYKYLDAIWYSINDVIKWSEEWIDFIHSPNLTNLILLKDLIFHEIHIENKNKVRNILW